MNCNKMENKKKFNIILIVGAIILIAVMGLFVVSTTDKIQSSFVYTDDGIFEFTVKKQTVFDGLFQQAVISSDKTEVGLYEDFTVTDNYVVPSNSLPIKKVVVIFMQDGGDVSSGELGFEEFPFQPGETINVKITSSVGQIGDVTFRTIYKYTDNSQFEEESDVVVKVIDKDAICSLDAYCDDSKFLKTINNGKIHSKMCYDVVGEGGSCEYTENEKIQTICDDFFVIKDTSSSTGNGELECVSGENNEDCTDDVTEMCDDNNTITLKSCVDGVLEDLNNSCPGQKINDTENETSTLITCWKPKVVTTQTVLSNETMCESYQAVSCGSDYTSESLCVNSVGVQDPLTLIILIIGGLLVIVAVVFGILKYRRII